MTKQQALYPYTMQPIALNLSEQEFKNAQLALFQKGANNFGLSSVRNKEWIVLGLVVLVSILGIVFVKGYSTIIFWLSLGLCVGYLLARTLGLKWYARREFDKQLAEAHLPPEMSQIKLGVQPKGLVVSMPMSGEQLSQIQAMQKKRGHTQQSFAIKSMPAQQAIIPWTAVTSWDETEDFVFAVFEYQGQKGSQIIPKRMNKQNFPIHTLIKHLQEVTPKGLKTDGLIP